VSRRWVVNSSPLIILARISQLDLLTGLCSEIAIPEGVAQEIGRGRPDDPAKAWLRAEGQAFVVPAPRAEPSLAEWDLGLGETQVISFARDNLGFEVLIDDRMARRCASSLGIAVRGTLGVIILARKETRLSHIEPILNQMVELGFRIRPELMRAALRLVNEWSPMT